MNEYTIEESEWAQRFFVECPDQYDKALEYACTPGLPVYLYHNRDAGSWIVSISVVDTGFLMDSFTTEYEARQLCNEMGWVIVE